MTDLINTKLKALEAAGQQGRRQSGAAPNMDAVRGEIDTLIEQKLMEKLDRRIDFRISKMTGGGGGGGRPAPEPRPAPDPEPDPQPDPEPAPAPAEEEEDAGPISKCSGKTVKD